MTQPWYTITVVRHEKHPRDHVEGISPKPVEVVACTVLPSLAGSILRATADEIAPPRPVVRERPQR
ncbi:hypothetical protein [Micromonospora arborensis]|uniref:hypothetical protein n=1 Tax=Micromonospora arborensis TaxID=2116518 RepID=UPI003710A2AF